MKAHIFIVLISALLLNACSNGLTGDKLIGTWEHPIETKMSYSVDEGAENEFISRTYERFVFKEDQTYIFGEYDKNNKALYEVAGTYKIDNDKGGINLYVDSDQSFLDVRKFDGNTFVTTSLQGNDFLYTKIK